MQQSQARRPATRPKVAFAVALIATLGLLLTACSLFDNDDQGAPPPTLLEPPPEVDIPYGPVAGCLGPGDDVGCAGSQTLDIYRGDDSDTPDAGRPVAIWVHGGGFTSGDKSGSLSKYFQPLLDDGWDLVSINYRLTQNGQNTFPVGLQDVKRAVRWIKANAADQGWNPDAVAAIGHSAGGNLVEMLATTADEAGLEPTDLPPELAAVDSSIIAAIAMAPVSDMRTFGAAPLFTETVHQYLACTTGCDAQLDAASVQTHVDSNSSPIMAIHGVDDPFAQPSQGMLVEDAYQKAGISDRFELIAVDDGPEDFRGHVPDMERWIGDVQDFLGKYLP